MDKSSQSQVQHICGGAAAAIGPIAAHAEGEEVAEATGTNGSTKRSRPSKNCVQKNRVID